jgi:hypothetical protein
VLETELGHDAPAARIMSTEKQKKVRKRQLHGLVVRLPEDGLAHHEHDAPAVRMTAILYKLTTCDILQHCAQLGTFCTCCVLSHGSMDLVNRWL